MNPQNILDKLGHSAKHPEFEEILRFFQIEERPVAVLQKWGGISITGVENRERGIYFDFRTEWGYNSLYGDIKSRFTDEEYELVLSEVTFSGNPQYSYQLPFGLEFTDDYKTIYNKIGGSLSSKSAAPDDKSELVYLFLTADYRVIVRQNGDGIIQFVRIFPIETSEKKSMELKKSLKKQNNNISNSNNDRILQLKTKLPTPGWKKSMQEGDSGFTEDNIAEAEVVFHSFLDQLVLGVAKKDASKIYSALKKAVKAFNKLHEKYEGFIDTSEREQIVEFFENAIKLTGFEIEEGVDLTQDIREW